MLSETCLAIAIFFEARSEPIMGQIAVANVIMNRVASKRYPDTICKVVWQKNQFSFTHDGKSDNPKKYTAKRDKRAWRIAKALAGHIIESSHTYDFTGEALHYFNPDLANPYWAKNVARSIKIGRHLFVKR